MRKLYSTRCAIAAAALALILNSCTSKKEQPKDEIENRASLPKKQAAKNVKAVKQKRRGRRSRLAGSGENAIQLSASHIHIMHNESRRKQPSISRTKAEALARAREAYEKIKAGADFAEVAKEYSDGPAKKKGGDLGVFSSKKTVPAFSKTLMALKIGEISEPIETVFGYHIIKRKRVVKIRVRHILVIHDKSKRKPKSFTTKRTKEEAEKRIKKIEKELEKPDADFTALAVKYSDCFTKDKGGELPEFYSMKMAPRFEKAAVELKINEISDTVETIFGFHIIQRMPLK